MTCLTVTDDVWIWKKKADKAAWAAAVFVDPPKNPTKLSDKQLSALTTGMLMQHCRIIDDSTRIVQTTKNRDTKQGRIDLCHKHYGELMKLKPFCNNDQLAMILRSETQLKETGII